MKKIIFSIIAFCNAFSAFAVEYTATLTDANQVWNIIILNQGTIPFGGNSGYVMTSKNNDYIEGSRVYESSTLSTMEFDLSQFKDVDLSSIAKATLTLTPYYGNSAEVLLCKVIDNSILTGNALSDSQKVNGSFNIPTYYTNIDDEQVVATIGSSNLPITIDVTSYVLSLGSFEGTSYLGFTFLVNGSEVSGSGFYGFDATKGAVLTLNTAVPEPATYAAILGALALGLVIWRRQK